MGRGDKGGDFDSQWRDSRRRGQDKAAKGHGPWADDKYLERINARPAPQGSGSDSCVTALALLGGVAWALSEVAGRVLG